MDEIVTTARDLELEVTKDAIEEHIMEHENEVTTEEFHEILNKEHQEIYRIVSPSEKEEGERGQMPTFSIKNLLKKWKNVRATVLECTLTKLMSKSLGISRTTMLLITSG